MIAAFNSYAHLQKVQLISQLTLPDAYKLLQAVPEMPEGYRRLIGQACEKVLEMSFPNQYYLNKTKQLDIFEAINLQLERIKTLLMQNPSEFNEADQSLLGNILDAALTDDFNKISSQCQKINPFILTYNLEALKFCQVANVKMLQKIYDTIKESEISVSDRKEWFLMTDHRENLFVIWNKWKRVEKGSTNWLMIFNMEISGVLNKGGEGSFYALIDYLIENKVNFVRHKPYLKSLIPAIVKYVRYDIFKSLIKKYNFK